MPFIPAPTEAKKSRMSPLLIFCWSSPQLVNQIKVAVATLLSPGMMS
jgi:hypothetical protein